MAENKITHDQGIITPIAVQTLEKYMKAKDTKALIEAIKIEEPLLLPAIKSVVDETALYFTEHGISGKSLSLIGDACFTCMLRGTLLYRTAIQLYDTNKLNEIYNQDFEAYENSLIDQYLESKPKNVISSGTINGNQN